MGRGYYDPVGRSVRAILGVSLVCFGLALGLFLLDIVTPGTIADPVRPFAEASGMLFGFGVFALIVHLAVAALVGAIRARGN